MDRDEAPGVDRVKSPAIKVLLAVLSAAIAMTGVAVAVVEHQESKRRAKDAKR
jgi:hypothetical protein